MRGLPSTHRPVEALRHRGLDHRPQLRRGGGRRATRGRWRACPRGRARPSSARRRPAAARAATAHVTASAGTSQPRGALAQRLRAAGDRVAREQRERRVDGQQPAAEEAALEAQVEEQRDREDEQQRGAARGRAGPAAPRRRARPPPRRSRGPRAASPGSRATPVSSSWPNLPWSPASSACPRSWCIARSKSRKKNGFVRAKATSVPASDDEPAARARSAASRRSSERERGREHDQPRRVLEADREPDGGAGERGRAQAAALGRCGSTSRARRRRARASPCRSAPCG